MALSERMAKIVEHTLQNGQSVLTFNGYPDKIRGVYYKWKPFMRDGRVIIERWSGFPGFSENPEGVHSFGEAMKYIRRFSDHNIAIQKEA